VLRLKNNRAGGLGVPLPAGRVALFAQAEGARLLIGESDTGDKAVGEEVELAFARPGAVRTELETRPGGEDEAWATLTVSNALPRPIRFEAEFDNDNGVRRDRFTARLARRPGKSVWVVTVPANGRATLSWRQRLG
jgi:hypothetical protein